MYLHGLMSTPPLNIAMMVHHSSIGCLLICSELDSIGLFRIYSTRPMLFPPDDSNLITLTDAPTLEGQQVTGLNAARASTEISRPDVDTDHLFDVFTNTSCRLLMAWLYSGTPQKSDAEAIRLAHCTSHPSLRGEETFDCNPAREVKLLDKFY
jgi:hypothetical protein